MPHAASPGRAGHRSRARSRPGARIQRRTVALDGSIHAGRRPDLVIEWQTSELIHIVHGAAWVWPFTNFWHSPSNGPLVELRLIPRLARLAV
jgi:hypothetical protein